MTVLKNKGIFMIGLFATASLFICNGFSMAQEAKTADPLNNPFEMRGDEGFVNAGLVNLPAGIRVLGILAPKGRDPVGVIEIPGMPNVYFVKSGDVIQVEFNEHGNKKVAGATVAPQRQIYLLVQSVTSDEIVIAPQTRPQETRIYR